MLCTDRTWPQAKRQSRPVILSTRWRSGDQCGSQAFGTSIFPCRNLPPGILSAGPVAEQHQHFSIAQGQLIFRRLVVLSNPKARRRCGCPYFLYAAAGLQIGLPAGYTPR